MLTLANLLNIFKSSSFDRKIPVLPVSVHSDVQHSATHWSSAQRKDPLEGFEPNGVPAKQKLEQGS